MSYMNEYGTNGSNNEQKRRAEAKPMGYSGQQNMQGGMYNQNPNYNYNYGYSANNAGEYSYQPQKPKKKGKKVLSAVLAVLCVCAIGTSSIVGYYLFKERIPINPTITNNGGQQESTNTSTDSSESEVDRTNLPTIVQLATPDDAMKIPDIVTKLSPSVVGISCITNGSQVSGTGIIMSEDGYIITNAHVVDGASAISVVTTDKTTAQETGDSSSKSVAEKILEKQNETKTDENTIEAELVGIDVQTDLAVLKIDRTGLTPAEFGKSSEIKVGEVSIVIGNPLGFDLANTVTAGIISATDRTLTIEDRTMNLIQTDASINSGNSGGPLINAYGQVIGVTSAKVSSTYGEGLGFAIPIDEALDIVNDLVQYGYVKGRPSLGISGENISSFYAQYYGVPQGFIVRSVEQGSAAEKAGIAENDIVVGIEGELISSIEEFNEIKSKHKAGDEITVSVYRNDNIVDLNVTLDEAANTDYSQQNQQNNQNNQNTPNNRGSYDDFQDFYNDFYGNW